MFPGLVLKSGITTTRLSGPSGRGGAVEPQEEGGVWEFPDGGRGAPPALSLPLDAFGGGKPIAAFGTIHRPPTALGIP